MQFPKIKKKKITITTADKWFSYYTRLCDAYESGYARCFTCGSVRWWKAMHCGHFVSRGKPMTRFNEQNCHSQCPTCNGEGNGQLALYTIALDKLYGEGTAQKLIDLGSIRGQKIHDKLALKAISDEYRIKAKKLAQQKGLEI
jgi:hypothetical protein